MNNASREECQEGEVKKHDKEKVLINLFDIVFVDNYEAQNFVCRYRFPSLSDAYVKVRENS